MTASAHPDRAVRDPLGPIVDLVAAVEHQLEPDRIHAVIASCTNASALRRTVAAQKTELTALRQQVTQLALANAVLTR